MGSILFLRLQLYPSRPEKYVESTAHSKSATRCHVYKCNSSFRPEISCRAETASSITPPSLATPPTPHVCLGLGASNQCLPGRWKPDVIRPGIVGMQRSMVVRLRPCMDINTPLTPLRRGSPSLGFSVGRIRSSSTEVKQSKHTFYMHSTHRLSRCRGTSRDREQGPGGSSSSFVVWLAGDGHDI